MTSNDLIVFVKREVARNWQNSDIHREGEIMLEKIAEHFLECENCADEFDAQDGYDGTLQEFANEHLATGIESDWICG